MRRLLVLAIAVALCPLAAQAGDTIGYSYVEAGYQGRDSTNETGVAIHGSIELGQSWFLFGMYSRHSEGYGSGEFFGTDTPDARYYDNESDYKRIGLGYHHALNPRLDFVARTMYDRSAHELRYQNGALSYSYDYRYDFSQTEAGLHGFVTARWEAWAFAGYSATVDSGIDNIRVVDERGLNCPFDYSCGELEPDHLRDLFNSRVDDDPRPYGRLGTQFRLTDTWGLTVTGRFAPGGIVSYFAGVRASF